MAAMSSKDHVVTDSEKAKVLEFAIDAWFLDLIMEGDNQMLCGLLFQLK